jgi:hypothetical protein
MDNLFISKASREGIYPFPNSYKFPLIYIDDEAHVISLSISGLHRKEKTLPLDTILVDKKGSVDRLTIRDAVVENHTGEPMTFLRNKGAISSLTITGCAAQGTEMIANEGTIENLCVR